MMDLKTIEEERQIILNEILDELETERLKDLFCDTRDKENRIDEVKDILETLYGDLEHYKRLDVSETLERIQNDYENYIQGGYLDSMYDSDSWLNSLD